MQALVRMTQSLTETYSTCNPNFDYSLQHNPRRPITKPSLGVANDGWDNENADLVMHINDVLVSNKGNRCARGPWRVRVWPYVCILIACCRIRTVYAL